jgi:hypothetical protein
MSVLANPYPVDPDQLPPTPRPVNYTLFAQGFRYGLALLVCLLLPVAIVGLVHHQFTQPVKPGAEAPSVADALRDKTVTAVGVAWLIATAFWTVGLYVSGREMTLAANGNLAVARVKEKIARQYQFAKEDRRNYFALRYEFETTTGERWTGKVQVPYTLWEAFDYSIRLTILYDPDAPANNQAVAGFDYIEFRLLKDEE